MNQENNAAIGERILDRLSEIAARQDRFSQLQTEKIELIRSARSLDPPLTWRQISEVTGVSEQACLQLLRRAG